MIEKMNTYLNTYSGNEALQSETIDESESELSTCELFTCAMFTSGSNSSCSSALDNQLCNVLSFCRKHIDSSSNQT